MNGDRTQPSLVVVIVSTGESCTAVPEDLLASIGDSITFKNLTGSPIILFFPNLNLLGQQVLELGPNQEAALEVGNVELGAYLYTVFCKGKQEFADKAARPRIIVYRTPG